MKTIQQAYTAIFKTETIDDIIFEGRNTQYGAYALRKDYNNHLTASMLAVISGAILIIGIVFFSSLRNQKPIEEEIETTITAVFTDVVLPPILPPPPATIQPPSGLIDASRFNGPPIVVENAPEENTRFFDPETVPDAPMTEVPFNYELVPVSQVSNEIDTTPYNTWEVNEKAMFQGGTEEKFRTWLAKHIAYPEDAAKSEVKGTVTLKFTVNKEGNVCDVSIVKGIHPMVDKAAVEALLSSPKWEPAKINGNKVKVQFYLPINFSLTN